MRLFIKKRELVFRKSPHKAGGTDMWNYHCVPSTLHPALMDYIKFYDGTHLILSRNAIKKLRKHKDIELVYVEENHRDVIKES